jgi:hypothetical protein
VYCWAGFKRIFCCIKKARVKEALSKILSFRNKKSIEYDTKELLSGDPVSLVIGNIDSFGGGQSQPWGNGTH